MTIAPGLYADISDVAYHADRASLSQSGAKLLLPPSTPAEFRWAMDHPEPPKKEFDHGHAAHKLWTGVGAELREIPESILAKNGAASTTEAKAFITQARADGAIPLKPADYAMVHAMHAAQAANPLVAALFTEGVAEQSGFWIDPDTGIIRRFRPDWLTWVGGQLYILDYKTSTTADPDSFARMAAKCSYHMQGAWYEDGVIALGMHTSPIFAFVVQSKKEPYLTSVVRLRPRNIDIGRALNRRAVDLYAKCVADGEWPGHPADFVWIDLPRYATYDAEELAA